MIYSKQMVDRVCELIIEGYDLRQIGAVTGLPSKATLCRWLSDERKIYFLDRYRVAKTVQHIVFAEEVVHLASIYGFRNMGQVGGRVHKLHLKRYGKPRNWWVAENENLYRYTYDEEGKRVPIAESLAVKAKVAAAAAAAAAPGA